MKRSVFVIFLAVLALCLPAWGQTIRVVTPHAGSTWFIDHTYPITWTRSGVMPNTVTIRLRVAGSSNSDPATLVIAASADNSGSQGTLSWRIPETVTAGRYFIRVKTTGSPDGTPEVGGDSADFPIQVASRKSLTVTSPDAASSWRPGSRHTITWTKTGELSSMVNLTLRRAGAPESEAAAARIADGTANNDSFVWFIPESLADGRYLVRIKEGIRGGIQDDSAVFAVSASGEGSVPDGPGTAIRADLEMPGVGVEYYNGHIVAWVKNNGPESVRDRDVVFRLNFPERGGGERVITRRITVPIGNEEGVQLQAMAASDIPEAGLQTHVRIDSHQSNISDPHRSNNGKVVRIWPSGGGSRDLAIRIADQRVTRVYVADGHPFTQKFRLRATLHVTNNTAYSGTQTTVPCLWKVQVRNTNEPETAWRDAAPIPNENTVEHGTLQLGPFRPGEVTSRDITIDFLIRDYPAVVYRRILFELDPNHTVNDPNRNNNLAATGHFDAE